MHICCALSHHILRFVLFLSCFFFFCFFFFINPFWNLTQEVCVFLTFGAKFEIPVARRGREISAPRRCERNPFHPLSSVNSYYQLLHIHNSVVMISHIWYIQVSLDTVYIQQLRTHSYRSKCYKARVIIYALLCSLWCMLVNAGAKPMA